MPEEKIINAYSEIEPGLEKIDNVSAGKNYEQLMAEQSIIAEKSGDGFTASTPVGEVLVRLATSSEAFIHQADVEGQREDSIKNELVNKKAPLAEWLNKAKETKTKADRAYKESNNAEGVLNEFRRKGNLLVVEAKIADKDFLPTGKFFVISPESMKEAADRFSQLGYYVKKLPGKGLTVEGPFAAYNFITANYLRDKQGEQPVEEDDDYDDEEEIAGSSSRTGRGKKSGKSVKAGKLSRGIKNGKAGVSAGGRRGNGGKGRNGRTLPASAEIDKIDDTWNEAVAAGGLQPATPEISMPIIRPEQAAGSQSNAPATESSAAAPTAAPAPIAPPAAPLGPGLGGGA